MNQEHQNRIREHGIPGALTVARSVIASTLNSLIKYAGLIDSYRNVAYTVIVPESIRKESHE